MRAGHIVFSFFFFQAEDGIRDIGVTGVDVCSSDLREAYAADDVPADDGVNLHLLELGRGQTARLVEDVVGHGELADVVEERARLQSLRLRVARSEERRVGKEWRSGWSASAVKKRMR